MDAMKGSFKKADRMEILPVYLFDEIALLKSETANRGVDIIDLGIGDPDCETPEHIIRATKMALNDVKNHRYSSYRGLFELRQALAQWYHDRFGVELDPEVEILPLIGSKEGIGHIHLAYVNPGEEVLIPDPGYPAYQGGAILAEGKPFPYPLLKENQFLPDLRTIEELDLSRVRMMHINFPSNPTTATASVEFFEKLVDWGLRHNIIICHDAAYSELYFDGIEPPSFLQARDAKKVGIEFHSLSKTYNMTGWRLGVAAGNRDILSALATVKSNYDSGIFAVIQWAGVAALKGDQSYLGEIRGQFQKRRDIFVEGLIRIGFSIEKPKATFFVWGETPENMPSKEFSKRPLKEAGVVVTPGIGFGKHGEGYFRAAMTVSDARLEEAIERINRVPF
jgi:LL-diaminopimelate aminotransferase